MKKYLLFSLNFVALNSFLFEGGMHSLSLLSMLRKLSLFSPFSIKLPKVKKRKCD